jgi:hypothetical protein
LTAASACARRTDEKRDCKIGKTNTHPAKVDYQRQNVNGSMA